MVNEIVTTNILLFGQLAEITGCSHLRVEGMEDTSSLIEEINRRYPAFATAKYMVAVNKKVISENTRLNNDSVVALLPPFSGG
jgi:molybdopterin synthase sulfur carrier subunit